MRQKSKKTATAIMVIFVMLFVFPLAAFAEENTAISAGEGGGLVAHYKFDGDFTDSSGNGHDGTTVGDITFADDGVLGKSAVFNGGFINVNSSPELNLEDSFTIAAWVKVDPVMSQNGNKDGGIVSKLDDGGGNNNYNVITVGTHGVHFHGFFTDGERAIQPGGFENWGLAEDWCFLVFSFDGQTLYLYQNGNLKATRPGKPGGSLRPSNNNMRIGIGSYDVLFKGKMDDLRLYNRALSSDEIKALYAASGTYQNKIELVLEKTTMTVNNVVKEIDPGRRTTPVIVENRTLVPIRAIVESMGGTVGWNAGEQRIDIKLKSKNLQLWVNRTTADLDGQQLTLDVPPKIINGRTMVPLRFVGESFGCKVQWDGKTKTVTIQY